MQNGDKTSDRIENYWVEPDGNTNLQTTDEYNENSIRGMENALIESSHLSDTENDMEGDAAKTINNLHKESNNDSPNTEQHFNNKGLSYLENKDEHKLEGAEDDDEVPVRKKKTQSDD